MNIETTTAMTRVEIIDRYFDVDLKFDYYCNYTFYYEGVAEDGSIISAIFGGDPDGIRGAEFSPVESLAGLLNEGAYLYDLSVKKP